MKKDIYELTKYEKVIVFYRDNPVEACRDIMKVDPVWFQRIQIKELWNKENCLLKWGRGTSKSFILALYAVLRAMLYPNSNIGIIGPTYRQTKFVFDYIVKLYLQSPFFRASVNGHISIGTERAYVEFHNGSSIEGLPIGHDGSTIRGRRYTIVILDEYAYHDQVTISLAVKPFLIIQHGYKPNQIIMASTPFYKTNHFWNQYQIYKRKSTMYPESYSCTSFNFLDVLLADHKEFRVDLSKITDQFDEQTLSQFLMEYAGYFPTEGQGFFPSFLISDCEPRLEGEAIEMEENGDPNCQYVMGVDPARSEDGANFALVIMKLLPNFTRHITRVYATRGKSFPDQVKIIREHIFMRKFNVVKLCIDNGAGGGGPAIVDLLLQQYAEDGVVYPSVCSINQVIDKNNYDSTKVLPILEAVNFSVPLIDHMYTTLKADMEHKKVLFPVTIRRDEDSIIEKHGLEFAMLKAEMQHIVPKPTSMGLVFQENRKLGKDRISACVLANLGANMIYKKDLGLYDKEEIKPAPIGFWA